MTVAGTAPAGTGAVTRGDKASAGTAHTVGRAGTATVGMEPGVAAIGVADTGTEITATMAADTTGRIMVGITGITMAATTMAATIMESTTAVTITEGTWWPPP